MTPTQRLYRLARRNERDPVYQAGLTWYDEARRRIREWASASGLGFEQTAAIVAVLSPQVSWEAQLKWTPTFLASYCRGRHPGFGTSIVKARRLFYGEPIERVLGGPKVRAFYQALSGDDGAVVLDRHMVAALGLSERLDRRGEYARGVEAVWRVSARLGVAPARLQAAVWCVWKRQSDSVPF